VSLRSMPTALLTFQRRRIRRKLSKRVQITAMSSNSVRRIFANIEAIAPACEGGFMATQFLALVLVFFAVGTAAYVQLVNIGVIYSW
jgi:hypothetical protein